MEGWTDKQMGKWMDGRTDGQMDRQTNGRTDERTDGWMDEWMDRWTDGLMDGWGCGQWVWSDDSTYPILPLHPSSPARHGGRTPGTVVLWGPPLPLPSVGPHGSPGKRKRSGENEGQFSVCMRVCLCTCVSVCLIVTD